MTSNFDKRKKSVLAKADKSNIGTWDKKIIGLCKIINGMENYYTTSSCAGRVVIVKDKIKKGPGAFVFVSHDQIGVGDLKGVFGKMKKGDFKFKQEPCILHIACKELKHAEELLKKAQLSGFKRSGIISHSRRFMCELLSTEKLELPLVENGKVLVSDEFLRVLVGRSNENLKKTWKKIEVLKKII